MENVFGAFPEEVFRGIPEGVPESIQKGVLELVGIHQADTGRLLEVPLGIPEGHPGEILEGVLEAIPEVFSERITDGVPRRNPGRSSCSIPGRIY